MTIISCTRIQDGDISGLLRFDAKCRRAGWQPLHQYLPQWTGRDARLLGLLLHASEVSHL